MNLKWIKVISVFGIFFISFLAHQMYDWFPNKLFSIFFPVNESIWEHLKMIFTTYLIWGIAEYFILKSTPHNNFIFSIFSTAIVNIILFLILYLPVYNNMGYNTGITILIFFISIVLSQIFSYFILNITEIPILNKISYVLIPVIIILFGILTYKTPKKEIFYDEFNKKYGVYNYYK